MRPLWPPPTTTASASPTVRERLDPAPTVWGDTGGGHGGVAVGSPSGRTTTDSVCRRSSSATRSCTCGSSGSAPATATVNRADSGTFFIMPTGLVRAAAALAGVSRSYGEQPAARGHPQRSVDPVGDHVAERIGADAGHHVGGGGRDGRFPRRGSGEGTATGSIGLNNYVIGGPVGKPAVDFVGREPERLALVGRPPHQHGVVMVESGRQFVVGGPDQAREPARAVTPHAGGGGEQRAGRQVPAQREQQGRLAAAADQGHQRPVSQPEGLSGSGQAGNAHVPAGWVRSPGSCGRARRSLSPGRPG